MVYTVSLDISGNGGGEEYQECCSSGSKWCCKKWNDGLREYSVPLTFTRSSLIVSRCR